MIIHRSKSAFTKRDNPLEVLHGYAGLYFNKAPYTEIINNFTPTLIEQPMVVEKVFTLIHPINFFARTLLPMLR